jgi:enterochelin esterase-like enzyme
MIRACIAAVLWLGVGVATPVPVAAKSTATPVSVQAGRVEPLSYHSAVLNLDRRILVYLPATYDADPKAHFPVLFLRHGGGGDENNWIAKGDAPAALDRMLGDGKVVPMVVVFTSGQIPEAIGSAYDAPGLAAAGKELVSEVIPLIESKYRVSTGGANRAMAGLSMGAGQSFAIGQAYSNEFSAIGVFSAGTFGVVGSATPLTPGMTAPPPPPTGMSARPALRPFDPNRDAAAALADPEGFNRRISIFYISVGDKDPRAVPTGKAIELMRAKGLRIISSVQKGDHEWPVWKVAMADFVPRLFGGRPAKRR